MLLGKLGGAGETETGSFLPAYVRIKGVFMETKVEMQPETIITCDICGEEAPLINCDLCGKEICAYCRAWVHFYQKEDVRGHTISFVYDRVICQSHLPPGIDAPIGE